MCILWFLFFVLLVQYICGLVHNYIVYVYDCINEFSLQRKGLLARIYFLITYNLVAKWDIFHNIDNIGYPSNNLCKCVYQSICHVLSPGPPVSNIQCRWFSPDSPRSDGYLKTCMGGGREGGWVHDSLSNKKSFDLLLHGSNSIGYNYISTALTFIMTLSWPSN